ncbi:sugar ABC transporter permease [Brachybacterium halotolerans subsp. kimchii]|uniref:carbohydrate ABC transporter permease n=1 Tax=Brachybacterium halotolerans TaxID=2795215 RepID=UPI001E3D21DB|nr:sugar ABC transporter permease [Brachybacterium halotolerans]UEJ84147.1 sugar ABC transporter permease [Brachybacterium halotolerans subsp. kimchii]
MTTTSTDASTVSDASEIPRRKPSRRGQYSSWLYLVPALAVFAVFMFFPLARSFVLSFQGNDILGRPAGFVGAEHYLKLLQDSEFHAVLLRTIAFVVLTVVPVIAISLMLSLLLHQRIRGIRFFRTAFASPFAFSVATASVIFAVMFNQATGVLNGILGTFGIGRVGWITDPHIALISIALTTVWMQMGYNLLVLSAGLGSVPDDIIEAARLDGAGGLRLQRSIIIPLLTPQIFFLLVTGTINSLQSFGQIHILTRGGPQGSTTTLVYSIYEQAFAYGNSNFGYASAQAIVLLIVVVVITALQFGLVERKVFYQ